jgi:hypothetical protein
MKISTATDFFKGDEPLIGCDPHYHYLTLADRYFGDPFSS